jgi:hypothetical protein
MSIPWSSDNLNPDSGGWDSSDAAGVVSAGYNFTKFDNAIRRQIDMGAKEVIVILGPIGFGGTNRNSPKYIFSRDFASSIGETQLYTAAGTDYRGSGQIAPGSCAQGVDSTAFPAVFMPVFRKVWGEAALAAVDHMAKADYAAKIPYIRVGGCCGGEWFPFATAVDTAGLLTVPDGPRNVAELLDTMLDYMAEMHDSLVALGSPFRIVQTLNGGYATQQFPYTYADRTALLAHGSDFGIGMQGLKQADISAYAKYGRRSGGTKYSGYSTADSAYLFHTLNDLEPLEVQTSTASDPTGGNATGSLETLLPYATDDLHATSCELYYEDWRIAYDRSHPLNPKFGQQYRDAFKAASAAGS